MSPVLMVCLVTLAVISCPSYASAQAARSLPSSLSDPEFLSLIAALSEPGGSFHSENLVSNEPDLVPMLGLVVRQKPTGVYVGVGPEQNFSYIANDRPEMAFIVDIRRENQSLHFLYKALFELSSDRVDFVSRLFSRRRPLGLGVGSTAAEIFAAYQLVEPTPTLEEETLRLVRAQLLQRHQFRLTAGELQWIDHVLTAFYFAGPTINWWGQKPPVPVTYLDLMTGKEGYGVNRSYLANEGNFVTVKDLQTRNLIVPVVGDFAGTKTLRAIGNYVREHDQAVGVFYGSNVADNLNPPQVLAFCANLGTLPVHPRSIFIGGGKDLGLQGFRMFAALLQTCQSLEP